jgi:hypothetical protein
MPSTVKEWNKLDIAIRKLDSLSSFLIPEYLVQTKKKWFASSWGAPQLHAGPDKI